MRHILIIRFSSIGDIILTSPLIRAVRRQYPEAEISFAVKKEFFDVVKHNPHIDRFFVYDKQAEGKALKALRQEVKATRFDWIIDIHKNFRSLFLKYGSGAALKTSYSKQIFKRTLLVKLGINRYKTIKPVYLRYFEAVKKKNIVDDGQGTEVFVADQMVNAMRERLSDDGCLVADRALVAVCPGARWATKRWMSEGFQEVARRLVQDHKAFIILLGGKGDAATCQQIHQTLPNDSLNYAGQLSLLESSAMLSFSRIVITNDTGMMHMAQAQKRPVVAIFGCTTKELGYFPIPENSVVVEHALSCRPCTHNGRHECPKKHYDCMKKITPDQVFEAAETLM